MATLDDKLLGEKTHYYCSSSEDEGEETSKPSASASGYISSGYKSQPLKQLPSSNTGPKGVLQDWQDYKKLEAEKRDEKEVERLKIMKKMSLSCKSYLDENKDQGKEDEDLDQLLQDDPIMQQYLQKRMQEMMDKLEAARPTGKQFGKLFELSNAQDFVDAIDKEGKQVTIVCHLYSPELPGCQAMNGCLSCLAEQYTFVKFCCLQANSAGMSKYFEKNGVPALLIYKSGQLIGNFVRLTDEFSDDFFSTDVEAFLIDHSILPDPSLVPELIKSSSIKASNQNDDSDHDY